MNTNAKPRAQDRRRGNIESLAHDRLTEWGDRREALGRTGVNSLARIFEGGQGSGHSDPTMACQIRDEQIYDCDRAVDWVGSKEPDLKAVLLRYYAYGLSERDIATADGVTREHVRSRLHTARDRVGTILMMPAKVRRALYIGGGGQDDH